jgi:alkyl hydroperoxide reductase subunit AhpC
MKPSVLVAVVSLAVALVVPEYAAAMPPAHAAGQGVSMPAAHSNVGSDVGSLAPLFTLDAVVDLEFRKVSLSDYRGKWVVLFFYPGDFTFVCPTEIKGFNKALTEFAALNAQVLAVSVDSKFSHLAWIKSGALDKLEYPLLSDFSKLTALSYRVLDEQNSYARRGLFIIDPDGMIQYRIVHNEKVGRSVEETLRVLKALQTQELCPINWKPGDKTIKK